MEKEIKRVQITCSCGTYIEIEDTSSSSINSIMDGFNEQHAHCIGLRVFCDQIDPEDSICTKPVRDILTGPWPEFFPDDDGADINTEWIENLCKKHGMEIGTTFAQSIASIMNAGNIKFKPEESEKCNNFEEGKKITYDPKKIYVYFNNGIIYKLSKTETSSFGWVLLNSSEADNGFIPLLYSSPKVAFDRCLENHNIVELNGLEELIAFIKHSGVLKPKEGWQKLDINNIPSDIITGKYEFREGNPDIASDSKLPIIEILEYLLPKSLKNPTFTTAYYYRKVI